MRQATGRAALGAEEGVLLRRHTIVRFGICLALAWTGFGSGTAFAIDGQLPTSRWLIFPGHEAQVMKLLAPWQEGSEVQGFRWEGARIDRFVACYLFRGPADVEAEICLAAHDGTAEFRGVPIRPLPALASAVLMRPRPADAASEALLDAVAARVTANAEGGALSGLWNRIYAKHIEDRLLPSPDDLLVWLPALLLWLLLAAARSMRGMPGGGWSWALGLLALSAALRYALPVEAPMTAWAWSRWTRIYSFADDSALLGMLLDELGGVDAYKVQSELLRITSIFSPLAVLGHSRKLFGAKWPAVGAALLLIVSPHHLRFSAADVQFIPSMLWSSAAFLWLYETLEARHPLSRALHLLGLVPLLALSLTARPLNIAYAPLMLLALAMAAQQAPRWWRWTVASPIVASAAIAGWGLISESSDAVGGVLSTRVMIDMATLIFRPDYDPLLYFRLTPPIWLPLILFGAALMLLRPAEAMLRSDDEPALPQRIVRLRGLWLCGWLFGYIALHGVVVVNEPMNNARYQLHSLPAMAMLGGVGLTGLWALGRERGALRLAAAFAVILVLAAPWLHRAAIADVDYVIAQERAFLRRSRAMMPSGCQLIEVATAESNMKIGRLEQMQHKIRGIRPVHKPWRVVVLDGTATALDEAGRAALAEHSRCQIFYEGVACAPGPWLAGRRPLCEQILQSGRWESITAARFRARVYDEGETGHLRANGDPVTLQLWRRIYEPGDRRPRPAAEGGR
ncbi:MAG: hypothetical protein H6747_11150 [Deltaproteobacteria bacterium]|nr:hypothetical protein [Deltaproteobacteria bacterium]